MVDKKNNITGDKMGKLTVSLSPEHTTKLKDHADKNYRSVSKEVSYLIDQIPFLDKMEFEKQKKEHEGK